MDYSKISLDNRAKKYVLDKLKDGKELSQEILSLYTHNQGDLYTYIKNNLNDDDLYSFKQGVLNLDYQYIRKFFFKETQKHLTKENSIVIFENSMFIKSDMRIINSKSNCMFFNDNVFYYILSEQNDLDRIETIFSESSCAWQNLFFFSSLPKEIKFKDHGELTDDLIRTIAERTEKVFVDAYDLDSYVCWDLEK